MDKLLCPSQDRQTYILASPPPPKISGAAAGRGSWVRAQVTVWWGGGEALCARQVDRQAPLLLCGSKVGGLEQVLLRLNMPSSAPPEQQLGAGSGLCWALLLLPDMRLAGAGECCCECRLCTCVCMGVCVCPWPWHPGQPPTLPTHKASLVLAGLCWTLASLPFHSCDH